MHGRDHLRHRVLHMSLEEPYLGSGIRCGVEELGRDYERCEEALEMVHGAVTDERERSKLTCYAEPQGSPHK